MFVREIETGIWQVATMPLLPTLDSASRARGIRWDHLAWLPSLLLRRREVLDSQSPGRLGDGPVMMK